MRNVYSFINGSTRENNSNKSLKIENPATNLPVGEVFMATEADIKETVKVAQEAFHKWRDVSLIKRSRVMFRFKQLLEENSDALAKIVSEEHGKTLPDAKGEIIRGIEVVEFACGITSHLKGTHTINAGSSVDCYDIREPLGITLGITPFNFPCMVPLWMFPISIACGNSFILKPSEQNPSLANELALLMKKAGLPDGVLNVIHGQKEAVQDLIKNPLVKSVSFVGSTPVAKSIYQLSAEYGKRVQALGGAKNHIVVSKEANLDQAVNGTINAAFGSAGQRCMAASVVAVEENVADQFINKLLQRSKELKVGAYEESPDLGPIINSRQLDKIKTLVDQGTNEGAELILDGRHIQKEQGNFIAPTIFDKVKTNMSIYREEIFGPVLSILRINSIQEGLDLVNQHEFGNGVCLYTESGKLAREFSRNVDAGMVGINVPVPVPVAFHSFGGHKSSLFGDHHIYGEEGVRFYTKLKTVTTTWNSDDIKVQLNMPHLN